MQVFQLSNHVTSSTMSSFACHQFVSPYHKLEFLNHSEFSIILRNSKNVGIFLKDYLLIRSQNRTITAMDLVSKLCRVVVPARYHAYAIFLTHKSLTQPTYLISVWVISKTCNCLKQRLEKFFKLEEMKLTLRLTWKDRWNFFTTPTQIEVILESLDRSILFWNW